MSLRIRFCGAFIFGVENRGEGLLFMGMMLDGLRSKCFFGEVVFVCFIGA